MRAGLVPPAHAPAFAIAAQWFQPGHFGIEPVVAAQAEMIGKIAEIPGHLAMRGIIGHVLTHGEIGKLGHRPGRDQMRAFIHGRARGIDIPQTPDIRMQLEPVKGDALLSQHLGRRKPHRARPDQGKLVTRIQYQPPRSLVLD